MRRVLSFIVLCLSLAGCGSVQTQTGDTLMKARQGAQRGYENLSARADSQHFCILGLRVSADGRILHAGVNAHDAGIIPGDKIIAVGGKAVNDWKQARELIARQGPGESVALTLLRNGRQVHLECPCVDISETAFATADALREASDGNWLECAEKMEQMQHQYGPSPLAQRIVVDCYNYYLLSQRKGADATLAAAVARLTLLNIEEASFSKESLELIREDVLAQVEWLKENDAAQLAEQVKRSYANALDGFDGGK